VIVDSMHMAETLSASCFACLTSSERCLLSLVLSVSVAHLAVVLVGAGLVEQKQVMVEHPWVQDRLSVAVSDLWEQQYG